MLPPAADRPKLAAVLAQLGTTVEELLLSGLTTASDATRQTLTAAMQEAARFRLLRLGSTLRTANEELGRFTANDAGFAHRRLLFFLTRAWLRFHTGQRTGLESAQTDLDEAWEIAERGPMRLHMADIHLYRARLFHSVKPYPWNKDENGEPRGPKDDLAAARKLIEKCGYWRRKEELKDAEEAAKGW